MENRERYDTTSVDAKEAMKHIATFADTFCKRNTKLSAEELQEKYRNIRNWTRIK